MLKSASRGGSTWSGGVCSQGGSAWSGGSAPGGVCLVWGGISQHALRQTPPLWTDRRLWKYYLGPTSLRSVKIKHLFCLFDIIFKRSALCMAKYLLCEICEVQKNWNVQWLQVISLQENGKISSSLSTNHFFQQSFEWQLLNPGTIWYSIFFCFCSNVHWDHFVVFLSTFATF